MGPGFSVISMRPSGRKASRQGSLKVATVFRVKGRPASGFCSPILTCAHAAPDATVKSNAAFANFVDSLSSLLERPHASAGAVSIVPYHGALPIGHDVKLPACGESVKKAGLILALNGFWRCDIAGRRGAHRH